MGFSLKQIQEKIIAENKPASTEIGGIKVQISIAIEKRNFTAYNVIGVVEGSDPILKNECIVYSAHFDHSGINEKGEVLNGADDDASGSIALLELAQAFVNMKKKPLRSVVFVWVNAEEKGLIGSQYYAENPVIPMEKTILNVNIDMIGRSITPADTGKFMGVDLNVTQAGEVQMFSGPSSSGFLKIVESAAAKTGVKVTDKGKNLPFGGSDHQSFEAKGVPFLFFHSGIHRDLHTERDDPDKIDYDKMEKVTKMLFIIGNEAANRK
jgi:Zn-dependent M28 family amino/carboxypeptidase